MKGGKLVKTVTITRRQPSSQERTPSSLERRPRIRSSREMVLIVCSAESQNYFEDIVKHLNLTSRIVIKTTSSNNPVEQVEEALQFSLEADPHRRLFALLDRNDSAVSDGERLEQINQAQEIARHCSLPNSRMFRLIITAPGFPLWLLLHFDEAEFSTLPAKEWPQMVTKKLAEFIPNSHKATVRKQFFAKTHKHLALAIKRSQKKVLINNVQEGPSTEIHELINYLLKLQSRYERRVMM